MWEQFQGQYLPVQPRFVLQSHELRSEAASGHTSITAQVLVDGQPRTITGVGNGPISSFVAAVASGLGVEVDVLDYAEHSMGHTSEANAVSYVETSGPDGRVLWGVGVDPNTVAASLRAVLSAVERHTR
jgi:2-isopropylmalate synthase